MQQSSQHFEDLVAKRLLQQAIKIPTEMPTPVSLQQVELAGQGSELSDIDFVKIEKNLAELGFFTPASKRVKNLKSKTITFSREIDGNRVECKVTFVPGALYGLPSTADQDKWLAFQKFVTDLQYQSGQVQNPITFLSADMLRMLGQTASGTNFKDIDEWLDRMWSTSIISEGMVYYAGKKVRVKDRTPIKVFTRAVTAGATLDDGAIAEKNYVWLSDWQLENINNNYQMPVDFETYKKLKNNIAKTLVPLLQIWLYATRRKGSFEKRYDEICQLLDTTQYKHASKITEKLGPSLDELREHGYLASWCIEKTSDGHGFKIILVHGEKFRRDLRRRTSLSEIETSTSDDMPELPATSQTAKQANRPRQAHLQLQPGVDPKLLVELARRGVGESGARKLLAKLPSDRPVQDLLEWGDQEIARQQGKISNPPGFYIRLLEDHSAPPPTFESSQQRKARQEAENERQRRLQEQHELVLQEEEADKQKIDSQIAALPAEQRQALQAEAAADFYGKYPQVAAVAKANPGSAINEGAIRNRMREMIAQGWKFKTPEGQGSHRAPFDLHGMLTTLQLPEPVKREAGVSPSPKTSSTIVAPPLKPVQ